VLPGIESTNEVDEEGYNPALEAENDPVKPSLYKPGYFKFIV
jgi:hypothetical protein